MVIRWTMSTPTQTQASPPKEFVEQVKQALEHLYDFTYLQQLPIAQEMEVTRKRSNETAGHHLRRELIAAVEAICPKDNNTQSPDMRIYNLLQLRYLEGVIVQEAANRLGLSTRQAHRSLRRGEESVAAILWNRLQKVSKTVSPTPASAQHLSSVQSEMARLETHLQPTDIRPLILEAETAVASLANALQLSFHIDMPDEPVIVSVDTAVAQQIFVSILSRVLRAAKDEEPQIQLTENALILHFLPKADPNPLLDDILKQLLARLGWKGIEHFTENGRYQINLNMTSSSALILVVDDNEGLVELLDRYLTGHHCRVVTTSSGAEGLKLAQELLPDAIILDVMMPGKSGWEVLQTLRSQPPTANTPIIVYSVFNDPDLAYSLGASKFLAKPISRDRILDALRELKIV